MAVSEKSTRHLTKGIAASALGAYHHYECDLFLSYWHRPPVDPADPALALPQRPQPSTFTQETFEKGNVYEADLKATLKTLELDPSVQDERLHPGSTLSRPSPIALV